MNLKYKSTLMNEASAMNVKFAPGYLGKWLEIHSFVPSAKRPAGREIDLSTSNQV